MLRWVAAGSKNNSLLKSSKERCKLALQSVSWRVALLPLNRLTTIIEDWPKFWKKLARHWQCISRRWKQLLSNWVKLKRNCRICMRDKLLRRCTVIMRNRAKWPCYLYMSRRSYNLFRATSVISSKWRKMANLAMSSKNGHRYFRPSKERLFLVNSSKTIKAVSFPQSRHATTNSKIFRILKFKWRLIDVKAHQIVNNLTWFSHQSTAIPLQKPSLSTKCD